MIAKIYIISYHQVGGLSQENPPKNGEVLTKRGPIALKGTPNPNRLGAKVTVGTDRTVQASCCNSHALTPVHPELQVREFHLLVPQDDWSKLTKWSFDTWNLWLSAMLVQDKGPSSSIQEDSLPKLWLERNSIRWGLIQSIDASMFNHQVQKNSWGLFLLFANGISSTEIWNLSETSAGWRNFRCKRFVIAAPQIFRWEPLAEGRWTMGSISFNFLTVLLVFQLFFKPDWSLLR